MFSFHAITKEVPVITEENSLTDNTAGTICSTHIHYILYFIKEDRDHYEISRVNVDPIMKYIPF